MKKQFSLLAICLGSFGIANAQTTTNTYSSTSSTQPATSTYSTTTDSTNLTNATTPSATMSTNGTNATMSTNGTTGNSGTMNTNGTTTNSNYSTGGTTTTSGTYSTNGATTTDYNTTTTDRPERIKNAKDYKNFVFGIYAGLNSTKFKGESVNTGGSLSGRLGYQAGFFVRGGGRLFGQLGAEYFASSSNYFTAGDGQNVKSIQDKIDIKYIQIPLYIGYKLVESDRGISAIRLQAGLEYANRISSTSGQFNLNNGEIKSGTFNGLAQLGFDMGAFMIDLTYHHGLSNSISNPVNGNTTTTGFNGSQRRVLSASVGFKF